MIIRGASIPVDGVDVTTWLEDPSLRCAFVVDNHRRSDYGNRR